ncbi:RDD family protein [Enterocloster citroniae]|uniref:RDD family protein n=1 Tax=Enterocloster citroniae TaxID=358743 RepID=UPI0005D30536|nr:RDD family protein [Clostridium sp. FS41]
MKRFIAFSIDLIIVELSIYFYIIFLFSMEVAERPIAKFSYFFGFIVYNFVIDHFFDGRSIGKRLVRIKVVFLDKNRRVLYTYTHGIIRYLSGMFSPFLGVYYLMKGKLPQDNLYRTVTENT